MLMWTAVSVANNRGWHNEKKHSVLMTSVSHENKKKDSIARRSWYVGPCQQDMVRSKVMDERMAINM